MPERERAIPEVVAHRGYCRRYPENTMVAIRAAIEGAARFVEIDVHLTSDRTPVLLHDEALDRVCGVAGLVHGIDIDALLELTACEPTRLGEQFRGEPVARLVEVRDLLLEHPEVRLFVELKEAAARQFGEAMVVERVIDTLGPVLDRCVMISFAAGLLLEVRRRAGCAIGPVIRKWGERRVVERFEPPPEFLFCDIRGLPRRGGLRVPGVELVVYEVPDAATAMRLHARGVGYVETFNAREMIVDLARTPPLIHPPC